MYKYECPLFALSGHWPVRHSALCQKRTLLASWNVSLPGAGQRLYAANPASNDFLHIAIFKFEV